MRGRARLVLVSVVVGLLSGCVNSDSPEEDDPFREAYAAVMRDHRDLEWDATMLVWAQPAPTLVLEISYTAGTLPSDEVWDALIEFLELHTDKEKITILPPKKIQVHSDVAADGYTKQEVRDLHRAHFEHQADSISFDGTIYRHILILEGVGVDDAGEPDFVGLYSEPGQVTVMIPEAPYELPATLPGQDPWSNSNVAILLHEFGHAMGLVSGGAPMLHDRLLPIGEDDCQCHSKYEQSLMSQTATRCEPLVPGVGVVCSRQANDLDEYDLADLAGLRDIGRELARKVRGTSPGYIY